MLQRSAVRIRAAFEPAVVQALHGMADHDRRTLGTESLRGEPVRISQLADVVPVHLDDVPALRGPVIQVWRRQRLRDRPVDPEVVVIERDDQVASPSAAARLRAS